MSKETKTTETKAKSNSIKSTSSKSTKSTGTKTAGTKTTGSKTSTTTKSAGTKTTESKAAGTKKKSSKSSKRNTLEIILMILFIAFVIWYRFFNGKEILAKYIPQLREKTPVEKVESQENTEASSSSSTTATSTTTAAPESESYTSVSFETLSIPVYSSSATESVKTGEVHDYNGFTLSYKEDYEVSEWGSYVLTREELKAVTGRSNKFHEDKKISTGSAVTSDYTGTGYDRGHLAPAADLEWSVESMEDSFLMSNMTPQAPQLNRGIWKKLEEQVRKWADKFGELVVIAGPVLEKEAEAYKAIGKNNVRVPEYFYKVILTEKDGNRIALGFIFPNENCEGDLFDYLVPIDEIEKRTNLDFFSQLDDTEEEALESKIDSSYWK